MLRLMLLSHGETIENHIIDINLSSWTREWKKVEKFHLLGRILYQIS